jgi:hypothetical protein
MSGRLVRVAYPVTVLTLVAGICVVAGFLATVAVPDLVRTGALDFLSTPAPSASPSASPGADSAMALSPIGIAMPSDADCDACHKTTNGTIGIKDIPLMAHPLKGFTDCTACHNPAGLVKTAPGHSSLHKDDCLVCHKQNPNLASASPPPMRPEHMGATGKACTSCHGVDKHAPLPADMAARGNNCWICHNGPEYQYLFASPGASGNLPTEAPSPSASAAPGGSPAAQSPTGHTLDPTAALALARTP